MVECGICASHDTRLLCRNCVNYKLVKLNLLSVNNEFLNELCKKAINEILSDCFDGQNRFLLDYLRGETRDKVEISGVVRKDKFLNQELIPVPQASSISSLASQLLKFHILIKRQKISHIERHKAAVGQEIADLRSKIAAIRAEKIKKLQNVEQLANKLKEQKNRILADYREEIDTLKVEKIPNSLKLINSTKFTLYQECLGLNIQRFKHHKQRILTIQYIPVIELGQLSKYSVSTVNYYLEYLITFQVYLSDYLLVNLLFRELTRMVPTSSFYNSFINYERRDSVEETPEVPDVEKSIMDDIGLKELKIDKLPLSSMTYNKLRRASLKSGASHQTTASVPMNHQSSSTSEEKQSPSTSPPPITGRKSVPHKLLTKPIKMLNQQELFKFVLTLSKLLVNFRVIVNSITGSSDLSFSDRDDYSIGKIINKLLKVDDFFFKKLEQDESMILLSENNDVYMSSSSQEKSDSSDKKWGIGSIYKSIINNRNINFFKKREIIMETLSQLKESKGVVAVERVAPAIDDTAQLELEVVLKGVYQMMSELHRN